MKPTTEPSPHHADPARRVGHVVDRRVESSPRDEDALISTMRYGADLRFRECDECRHSRVRALPAALARRLRACRGSSQLGFRVTKGHGDDNSSDVRDERPSLHYFAAIFCACGRRSEQRASGSIGRCAIVRHTLSMRPLSLAVYRHAFERMSTQFLPVEREDLFVQPDSRRSPRVRQRRHKIR